MVVRKFKPDRLIVNSPYVEPTRYWSYDRETRLFELREGARRPAGYIIATPGSKAFDDPGVSRELPLVNRIRPRIRAWREAGYPGVTGITRRLLEHWYDPQERRDRRFFFCQLEAIETLIWLAEASPAERQGIDIEGDGGPFPRVCAKMATGSGKTIVMAMAIAWHILNKATYPQDPRFSKHVLVVAPGLTVRNRLSVLELESAQTYYDEFNIVPAGLAEKMRQGKVKVRNWHKLDWESDERIRKKRSVDKRGAKSDEAYVRDVLEDMAPARNLLVVNDEAHHAWRVPADAEGLSKAEVEEATKWIGGLDRIHRARGILGCLDFSATPFIPSGKKSSEEALFQWIASDFGLNDAIESGLVKTPRVVVRDDSVATKEIRSRLYHIYADDEVKTDLNRKAPAESRLPDLVINGYYLLGLDWRETLKRWQEAGHDVPPVMISVANRTETAARIKHAFDRGHVRIDELASPERTLHIDSKVLETAEAREEAAAIAADDGGDDDEGEEERAAPKLTKDQQAELLRRMVDTVGRTGEPGAPIQNVISVGMLSEGWDAKTVTHIMGLRAFTSQLLCEQVVGRGLRRTSYEVDKETGLFEPEYVNIFGVPFTFLPHQETGDGPPPPPPPPKTRVEPDPKKREFEITWPNVLRVEHVLKPTLALDVAKLAPLTLDATQVVKIAELAPVVAGKPDLSKVSTIELEKLARERRLQRIVFETAADVFDQVRGADWKGNKDWLLAQLIRLVEDVLASDRIAIVPPSFAADGLKRRIVLTLSMTRVVQHVAEAIRFQNAERLEPVFDPERPVRSTGDMRPWYTGRPCERTKRSHINFCVYDSRWEAQAAFELDRSPHVTAWAKNDHLGFEILYLWKGVVAKYRPDYLVRLSGGTNLVLEVKGRDAEREQAKRRFLDEWVSAVNAHGGFGKWAWDVALEPADVPAVLERRGGA